VPKADRDGGADEEGSEGVGDVAAWSIQMRMKNSSLPVVWLL
jgi:hypothetical protein